MSRNRVAKCCLSVGFCLSTLAAGCLFGIDGKYAWISRSNGAWIAACILCLLLGVITLDLYSLDPSPSHTIKTLLGQYIFVRVVSLKGYVLHSRFVKSTKNCRQTQSNLLMSILRQNAGCEYGRKYDFQDITDAQDYARRVPLNTYEDFREYIDRMVERGEWNVLLSREVVAFANTSGTSGAKKFFPLCEGFFDAWVDSILMFYYSVRGRLSLGRTVFLRHNQVVSRTPTGLPVSSIGGLGSSTPRGYMLSPAEVYEVPNVNVALYLHALFAVRERDVNHIDAFMAPLCYAFFNTIDCEWERLCRDIENGYLGDDVDLDPATRGAINQHLTPDRLRAAEVRQAMQVGNVGLARRLWPTLSFMQIVSAGGGFAQYTRLLDETHVRGVPHGAALHGASEAIIGSMIAPEGNLYTNRHTLLVNVNFFEFIPEEHCSEDVPSTVFAHQLQKDKCYEVVITTNSGLYRYRLGDVIKCVDYINTCPVYEFIYRYGQSLSVHSERTTERVIHQSVLAAEKKWPDLRVINYTTTESTTLENLFGERDSRLALYHEEGRMHHYVFFVEVEQSKSSSLKEYPVLTQDQKLEVDAGLRAATVMYDTLRQKQTLSGVQVIQVARGTFDGLKQLMTATTRTNQFKMPVVLRQKERLDFLLDNIVDALGVNKPMGFG